MTTKIKKIIMGLDSHEISGRGNGWINLAKIGAAMGREGIKITGKLMPFFEQMSDDYELYEDFTGPVKVVYLRPINNASDGIEKKTITYTPKCERNGNKYKIEDWAFLRDINSFLNQLADMSLKENWSYMNGLPKFPNHPILWSYVKYTFCRLQHQNRIAYSMDKEYAAFNTGLVDYRYMPIIALFKRNFPGKKSEWVFYDFVIPGEGNGKKLNQLFESEVMAATYTENPSELVYDVNLGMPYIDYDHIIVSRAERLPYELLRQSGIRNFELKNADLMTTKEEKLAYYAALKNAIKNDSGAYRYLVNCMESAIKLAIKRVRWNYKNAVPMFYPKENRMCLLLPLCLVDDNREDLALVVKKTPANEYEGATIISLDCAYTDARVVARPNSEWLDISKETVKGSNEI